MRINFVSRAYFPITNGLVWARLSEAVNGKDRCDTFEYFVAVGCSNTSSMQDPCVFPGLEALELAHTLLCTRAFSIAIKVPDPHDAMTRTLACLLDSYPTPDPISTPLTL